LTELTEEERIANQTGYQKEKLLKLESLAAKARGDLRMAKIEVELAESKVETQEAMVGFAEAAVDYQRDLVERTAAGDVPSTPDPAPPDSSPPQGDPAGAGSPTSPPSTPAPSPPSVPASKLAASGEFDPHNPPPAKSHARAAWNIEATRRLLRREGTVRAAAIRQAIDLGAGAARLAIQALIDSGEVLKTGNRASTQYHWQGTFDEEPGGEEAMSGPTRTEPPARTGVPVQPDVPPPAPPTGERKHPVSEGPPSLGPDGRRPQSEPVDDGPLAGVLKSGRGRTSKSDDQEPSFQGVVHNRLITKPMTMGQMLVEWPNHTEGEVRQAVGENMKAGDVRMKQSGDGPRYHGIM
jgi:hypothetical protein